MGTTIAHWNCRGIQQKKLRLEEWLNRNKVNILVVNEHMRPQNTDIHLKNYGKAWSTNASTNQDCWGTASSSTSVINQRNSIKPRRETKKRSS